MPDSNKDKFKSKYCDIGKVNFMNNGNRIDEATELYMRSLSQKINPIIVKNIERIKTVKEVSKENNLYKIIDIPLTPPTTKSLGTINMLNANA